MNVPAESVTLPLISSVRGAVKLPVVSVKFCAVRVVVEPDTLKVCPAVIPTTIL